MNGSKHSSHMQAHIAPISAHVGYYHRPCPQLYCTSILCVLEMERMPFSSIIPSDKDTGWSSSVTSERPGWYPQYKDSGGLCIVWG